MSRIRRGWLVVFLTALAVRVPLLLNMAPHPDSLLRPDSRSYMRPAANLARHGVYSASEGPPFEPDIQRPPGYPVYLAGHLLVSDSLLLPAATQTLLDAGSAALISLAAAGVSPHPAAWAAGLLYALDPLAAAHAPLILSEALFLFLLSLGLLLLLRGGSGGGHLVPIALSGLCLGLATLVRPVTLYLWLPWSLVLAWVWPKRLKKASLLFAACALLLPALWCVRSWNLWGDFSFNPARSGDAVLWEAASVQAAVDGISVDEARAKMREEFLRLHPDPLPDALAETRARKKLALRIILAHPIEVVKMYPVSVLKMMLGPGMDIMAEVIWPGEPLPRDQSPAYKLAGTGTLAVLRHRPGLWLVLAWVGLNLLLYYGLAAAGAWRLWRLKQSFALSACLAPALYLIAISAGGWVYYRLRLPVLPFLAVLAAGILAGRSPAD